MKPPADNLLKDWLYTIHQGMSCSFIEYPEWNVLHERVSKSSHTRLFSRSPDGFIKRRSCIALRCPNEMRNK